MKVTTSPKARKPARSIAILWPLTSATPGTVRITVGQESAEYTVSRLDADFGRAFRVRKAGALEAYCVNLAAGQHQHSSCECKGWLRYGHCRHVSGLLALVAAGKL
jgi:hypothetical protein